MLNIKKYTVYSGLVLILLIFCKQFANAQEIVQAQIMPKPYSIENCVNQFSMENTVKTNAGYQYWFADKDFLDGRTLKMSVVAPKQATHEPHQHPEDEFFFILEGTAKFFLDGKSVVVGPYTSLYCPPMLMHGISNVGETELKYLVIKKYQN